MCIEYFGPGFGQGYIDIVIITIWIQQSSDQIQMIDALAMFSKQGDEITKSGELSDRGIGFSEVCSFIPVTARLHGP